MRDRLLQRDFWETATLDQVREQLPDMDMLSFALGGTGRGVMLKCPNKGATLLHLACRDCPDPDAIQALISHGFDVNMRDEWDLAAPIHYAARHNPNPEVIRVLIKAGAGVNVTNRSSHTPLHLAVKYNSLEVVSLLLTSGADVNAVDHEGNTPLHYAAIWRPTSLLMKMLIKHGANEGVRNDEERTPEEDRVYLEGSLSYPRTYGGTIEESTLAAYTKPAPPHH